MSGVLTRQPLPEPSLPEPPGNTHEMSDFCRTHRVTDIARNLNALTCSEDSCEQGRGAATFWSRTVDWDRSPPARLTS